jgi:hypothetical protein
MYSRQPAKAAGLTALAVAILAVSGCGASAATAATAKPAPAAATPQPSPSASVGGLKIYFEEGSQVELVDPAGTRVLIDVYDETKLTAPPTAADILLTTNAQNEAFNATFQSTFPGRKLYTESGDFTFGDLKVTSIVAAEHDDNVAVGTNRIYVFEFGGLRVAHLGWTGQAALTDEQLAKLGRVDVAFSAMFDLTGTDPTDARPLKLIEQLKPRLFVPTELKLATLEAAKGKWPGQYTSKAVLTLTRDQLPETTTVLFMGRMSKGYGSMMSYPESTW